MKTREKKKQLKEPQKTDVSVVMNTVIDGAYCACSVLEKKGILFVGEKEISHMNCESYETTFENDIKDETKKMFSEHRKKIFNLLDKIHREKYLLIRWRNGEKSVVCIDAKKYTQIIKILS
ncbi:MAG: hypothetical protein IKG39_11955 [Lachnospiraceae bacterium]|nr:hypothetical protein [Lachnospiraceae bacterium]